jgi:hypothetical protein
LGINHPHWIGKVEHFAPNIGWSTQIAPDGVLNQTIYTQVGEFIKNTWYKITFQIKMNVPGQYNGIGKIWLNDKLVVDASDVMWINPGNFGGIANFRLLPIWGGGGPVMAQTQYIYFDDVILQNRPFR